MGNYSFALVEIAATHTPIKAISRNDALKVASPAIKPMIAGPISNPLKPIVDTAARATPGDIFGVFPAEL